MYKKCVVKLSFKALLMVLLVAIIALPACQAYAGQFVTKTYNGWTYKLYIPSGYVQGTPIPLVVMLHGTLGNPDDFAAGTKMNSLAGTEKFLVLYPKQKQGINAAWQWYQPAHQSRGSGEPAIIAGMARQVQSQYSVDNKKVYVLGFSAGAAMSCIMGVTYPDVFAAVGVHSGLEFKAATSYLAYSNACKSGGPNPETQGSIAYTAMGSKARAVPVVIFHGSADRVVYPINGIQVAQQWADTDDRSSNGIHDNNVHNIPDQTSPVTVVGRHNYTKYTYKDNNGKTWIERYLVDSMGHAWSGGSTAGSYTDPAGPDASRIAWNFFKANPKP